MGKRFQGQWLALAFGLAVSGCSSIAQISDGEQQQILAEAQAPRLQAGEKIRVNVYGEASLSGDYQIDPSGFVSVPLAGNIKAVGLTQNELAEALATSFRSRYLKNPKVTVSVAEFRPFYIIGEIEKPGSYPYTSGLNVLSAIAIAGGTTYRASKSTILIQHPGENALREYKIDASVPILPGDIIKVPQRYF
jgi:polysaccharide export outer membrane protein